MRMDVMASYTKWTLLLLLLCGLFTPGFMTPRSKNGDQRQRVLTYTRDMLLALRDSGVAPPIEFLELQTSISTTKDSKYARGKEAGKVVSGSAYEEDKLAPPPSMILSNARSLKPKMDELRQQANV